MSSATIPAGAEDSPVQHFSLRDVDWATYRTISDALAGRHLRLTYDRGNLELVTISSAHGKFGRLVHLLIFVLAEELGKTISSHGDMTCDRADLDRGVEPDECFYLEHEPLIRDKEQINLEVDPPPDLAVEIDISRSSRHRLGIYAALGVPEVWRFDGAKLTFYALDADGSYTVRDYSRHFPKLLASDILPFLLRHTELDEVALIRSFREWVRQRITEN